MRQKYSIGPVWFLMFACAFFTSCVTQGKKVQQDELSQYVEPRIGTAHCRWFHSVSYTHLTLPTNREV